MTVLGIAGGSASGKSTLAKHICDAVDDAVHINLDDFYMDVADQPETFDDPSALRWSEVRSTLVKFQQDGVASVPRFSFGMDKCVGYDRVEGEHAVVEGLWTLYDEDVRNYCIDVGVFIQTPADVRLARRIRRDTEERDVGPIEAVEHFETAREKEKEYVKPTRQYADVIVDGRPTERDGEILGRLL